MKKVVILFSLLFISILSCLTSCQKQLGPSNKLNGELNLPDEPYEYYGSSSSLDLEKNKFATIGRVLFYDKHLSKNFSVSCASCHIQAHAFGDNKAFSLGIENKKTPRNSMAIHNIDLGGSLFWDAREDNLYDMVLQPSLNHIEMGLSSREEILQRIKSLDYYAPLFDELGENEITILLIEHALVNFVRAINVDDSKFDHVEEGKTQFTALEAYGESIFNGKYNCNSCHGNNLSNYGARGNAFVNIGLDIVSQDNGRMDITQDPNDKGAFKIPGLRNVQFSAPYMHDGRFRTLGEVIDHYSHGIKNTPNLDFRLRDNGTASQLNISDHDKKALIAFLHTMTDYDVLSHDRFSDPFSNQ